MKRILCAGRGCAAVGGLLPSRPHCRTLPFGSNEPCGAKGRSFLMPGVTRINASLTRGFRTGDHSHEFPWPQGHGQIDCDLSTFSRSRHTDLVNSFVVDPAQEHGYFTAWNPGMGVLFGYLFSRHAFPWLNVWESNDDQRQTRGMEFSNTPVNGTMRELFEKPEIWALRCPNGLWLREKSESVSPPSAQRFLETFGELRIFRLRETSRGYSRPAGQNQPRRYPSSRVYGRRRGEPVM